MKKMFEELRTCRDERKKYRIRNKFQFRFDRNNYMLYILPTVTFQPWLYRPLKSFVIVFRWLHIRIAYGLWERREENLW